MADNEPTARFPWRFLIFTIALVIMCGIPGYLYLETLRSLEENSGEAVDRVSAVAEKFQQGSITETFIEEISELRSTDGNVLEVSQLETWETFVVTDEKRTLWGRVNLGTSHAEIRVPVTYRYHILLTDPWQLHVDGNVLTVDVPPLRASQPPAIHTDRMQKDSGRGWARFNKDELLAGLEANLTPAASERAEAKGRYLLAKPAARESVREFVRTWLLREDQWGENAFGAVLVRFPDEVEHDPRPRPQQDVVWSDVLEEDF